jgi:hypothetical protein
MSRLGDKIPVPPLDPARRARIEDQVAASLPAALATASRPTPSRWPLAIAAGAVAAAAALLLLRPRPDSTPSHIEVGGAAVDLAPGSRVAVHDRDGAILLDLESGRVDCELEPRPGRPPFAVRAGDVTVEVVGTIFSVERGDDVRVSVTRGVVSVTAAGRARVKVAAGETWSRGAGERMAAAPSEPVTPDQEAGPARAAPGETAGPGEAGPGEKAEPAETAPGRGAPGDRGGPAEEAGPSRGAPSDRGAPADRGTPDRGAPGEKAGPGRTPGDRGAAAPETPRPGQVARTAAGSSARTRPSRKRPDSEAAPAAPAPPPAPTPPAGLPELACDDRITCRVIALQETGPRAGRALYSLIYLQLFQAGDPDQAVTLAELYERRFGRRRAREAEAVLWLRVLAHRRAGDSESARAAAERYLERHPRGRFADEASRQLAE